MANSKGATNLDYTFFQSLLRFYLSNKKTIRKHYKRLTLNFLDYNDPTNVDAFLRRPQFEALEIYVFLKEFSDNIPVYKLFMDWYYRSGKFSELKNTTYSEEANQKKLFDILPEEAYKQVFSILKENAEDYSNYIFALTMGTGKTILMATCIFYEFLLANKFPKDTRYCHNALVFAPDKTVLQSLREIMLFDKSKVVPKEYLNFLDSNIKFHFLDNDTYLNTIEGSKFNIIISNTQKIILKRKRTEINSIQKLYEGITIDNEELKEATKGIWDFEKVITQDSDLKLNQRFQQLLRLEQLGIYVDEAHHLFGNQLEKDILKSSRKTSLRTTIDLLATNLKKAGTQVVACYNFTGTPYVKNKILPEVVYAYGLQDAIDNRYLKQVEIHTYEGDIKDYEFIKLCVEEFWKEYSGKTYEGLNPKIAFFSPTIDDLVNHLKPQVEKILIELGINTDKILVNVGDQQITTNDDIRNFNNLDKAGSEGDKKQFILLVNKGKEGWNCRSLFGVALYRKPDSTVFVLQATMRCLRDITDDQQTAKVFLSKENYDILDNELQSNFRVSINEITKKNVDKKEYKVYVENEKELEIKRKKHKFSLEENKPTDRIDFELNDIDYDKYKVVLKKYTGIESTKKCEEVDKTAGKEKRKFCEVTLVAEIARYLNLPCLKISKILKESEDGKERIIEVVNEYNEIIYDIIIPKIFYYLYTVKSEEEEVIDKIKLIKTPDISSGGKGYFVFRALEELVSKKDNFPAELQKKSFHTNIYCFDSKPEKKFFLDQIEGAAVKEIYFTGMFTHGQSDFFIQYIDPDSKALRSYYPDFLMFIKDTKGKEKIVIVEVKGDNKKDDDVVQAKKEYAEEVARNNDMEYIMLLGSEINSGDYIKQKLVF